MAKAKSQTKAKAEPAKAAKTTAVKTTVRHHTVRKRWALREELVLGALLGELVGVFALTSMAVIVTTSGALSSTPRIDPFYMALSFFFVTILFARVSGGHMNPVITLGHWVLRKITWVKTVGYIVAQLLGAALALVVMTQFINAMPFDAAFQQEKMQAFQLAAESSWRPFFTELMGAIILGLGVGAALLRKEQGGYMGYVFIAGALFLGVFLTTFGSAPALLNPAIAVALNAYSFTNLWSLLGYAVGPALGAVAGVMMYKLMVWDVENGKE